MKKFIEHELKTEDGVYIVEYRNTSKLWLFMIFVIPLTIVIGTLWIVVDWWASLCWTGISGMIHDYDYDQAWGLICMPYVFVIAKKVKIKEGERNDQA